jgi:hypothetical protein
MNTIRTKILWLSLLDEGCVYHTSFGRWLSGAGHATLTSTRARAAVSFTLVMLLAIAIVALSPRGAAGQAIPTTNKGWIGLKSGTQPPPGQYVTFLLWNYNFDTLKTNDGTQIGGGGRGNINLLVPAIGYSYVSEKKILGANYSATWALPLANTAIDFPRLEASTSWGASDMYFQPIQLGWHLKNADLVAGYALYVPTGRFNPAAFNSTGLGQWSNEFSAGFTFYPNEKKSFHLATLVQYYIESGKEKSDQRVGDSLQLQGGAGMAFKEGLINAGMAYYAQWKMTEDRIPSDLPDFRGKNRYLGFGPEFNTVLPISKATPVFATFRYLFETGNRVATQGNTLFFSLTVVIPTKK